MLDQFGITATFLVCGAAAEKYPDAICAARKAGHEIAGMSYGFEQVRTDGAASERAMEQPMMPPPIITVS